MQTKLTMHIQNKVTNSCTKITSMYKSVGMHVHMYKESTTYNKRTKKH